MLLLKFSDRSRYKMLKKEISNINFKNKLKYMILIFAQKYKC